MQSANEICSSVCYFSMEVQKLERNAMKQTAVARYSWKPPPADIYKINSDGSFDPSSRSGGWGFVVRDSSGEVLAAGAGNIHTQHHLCKLKLLQCIRASFRQHVLV